MGRMGVYEIMLFSEQVQEMVSHEAPLEELRKQAFKEGMHSCASVAHRRLQQV